MAVFSGDVKVGRAVKDPGTDKSLPAPGSLSYGAIASTSALAACPGTDAQLIHGDKWIKIDAKQTGIDQRRCLAEAIVQPDHFRRRESN